MDEQKNENLVFKDKRLHIRAYDGKLGGSCTFGLSAWESSLQFTHAFSKGKEYKANSFTIGMDEYDTVTGLLRHYAKQILRAADLKEVKEQVVCKFERAKSREDKTKVVACTIKVGYSESGVYIVMALATDGDRNVPSMVHYFKPDPSKLKAYQAADVTLAENKLSAAFLLSRLNHWDAAVQQWLAQPKKENNFNGKSGGYSQRGNNGGGSSESKPAPAAASFDDVDFDF